jgi:hypothetical protein
VGRAVTAVVVLGASVGVRLAGVLACVGLAEVVCGAGAWCVGVGVGVGVSRAPQMVAYSPRGLLAGGGACASPSSYDQPSTVPAFGWYPLAPTLLYCHFPPVSCQ